ncbi:MAG: FAD-binding dehydrogenase [Nitratireductor sp.]|nr:FAD-binding dehydrogenase [Nitratireductor sp.]
MAVDTDVIIVGAGLAGLVAACELVQRNRRVILLDQEGEQNLGGQAFWSLGGLFMIDTPEQRRMRIRDSRALAEQDWMGSAGFDRPEDNWPRKWAEHYLDFANGEMRSWLHGLGMRWFPVVGWAERGGGFADGHGNSVPRFHITWGTGPGVLEPFVKRVLEARKEGRIEIRFRHRATSLIVENGTVCGVEGERLEETGVARGEKSSRNATGSFSLIAQSVIVTTGGIGGNLDLVRQKWPVSRVGKPPRNMISGVPHHVDGLMLEAVRASGASLINEDRMWHYTEGVRNFAPIWPNHGIRVLPGPSSMWFDALGNRMPVPCLPGFDTLGTLKHILSTGHDWSWFVLTQKIIKKEFALSGSEQNPDFTSKSWGAVLKARRGRTATPQVEAFKQNGEDFVVANSIGELAEGMNRIGNGLIDADHLRRQIEARDREIDNPFSKDVQVTAIRGARNYLGDRLIRTAKPHKLLEPANGPLIAVRLNILTRKTLGGIETDLDARALRPGGAVLDGLYAAGEASGFGGGGYHGYNALEGTFLGGCIFSGRAAGRSA